MCVWKAGERGFNDSMVNIFPQPNLTEPKLNNSVNLATTGYTVNA
jgi:hypothetical protein